MSAIDEAAEALGVDLLPWQREIGQRILDGERVVMSGGRRVGRATLRRVLAKATESPGQADPHLYCAQQYANVDGTNQNQNQKEDSHG